MLVALSYGLGSALVLYLLMLGGRRVIDPLKRKVPQIQAAMGAVMILFGVGMFANLDLKFQNAIADRLGRLRGCAPQREIDCSNIL